MSQTHSHAAAPADNYQLEISRWNTGRNVLVFAALLGIIGCIAGYVSNPARLFQSYMVAFAYTTLIGLGAFFFVMVQFLTGSAWSVTMRRIMENIMITLPVGLILFIPVAIGLDQIYPWTNQAIVGADAGSQSQVQLPDAEFLHHPYRNLFLPVVAVGRFHLSPIDQARYRALHQANAHRLPLECPRPVPRRSHRHHGLL